MSMSLVTAPRRLVMQLLVDVGLAPSSSLVTALAVPSPAFRTLDAPLATPAPAARSLDLGSNRDFADAAAIAAGSPPYSRGGTRSRRNTVGVHAALDRDERTHYSGSICAARRVACFAPSRRSTPLTNLSLVTPHALLGKKIHPIEEDLFYVKPRKNIDRRKRDFQTACSHRVSSRRWQSTLY